MEDENEGLIFFSLIKCNAKNTNNRGTHKTSDVKKSLKKIFKNVFSKMFIEQQFKSN